MTTQSTPLVMILASWIHFCFGLALSQNPDEVSRIAVIAGINIMTEFGIPADLLGQFVMFFSVLALVSFLIEERAGRTVAIALVFPQYTLLFIAFLSDLYILYDSKVMGRDVDFWVLFSILPIMMGLAVVHTIAIFERYGRRWIQV